LFLDSAHQNHRQKHCAVLQSTLSTNRQGNALDEMLCGYLLLKYAVPNLCALQKSQQRLQDKASHSLCDMSLLLEIIKEERMTRFLLPINTSTSGQNFSLVFTKTEQSPKRSEEDRKTEWLGTGGMGERCGTGVSPGLLSCFWFCNTG